MAGRYLLHFAQEHISFRWPEFLAVTSRNSCEFKLISDLSHVKLRPFIIVQLEDDKQEERLIKSASECYLLKDLYELWASSTVSLQDLSNKASMSPHYLSKKYSGIDQSFRINCETFGVTTKQSKKIEMIKEMKFLEGFQCRPNLSNPKQIYCILEMNEKTDTSDSAMKKEFYFGRHLATSDRKAVHKFSLKERVFIANTSMDPLLSLVTANTASIRKNDITYDPFVGSGSLIVAAAYMGAYVIGADIDWMLLHGKSRSSRKGVKKRQPGESIRANLKQYELESRYLDVLVSDISRRPFGDNFKVDSIITDPPYGIRECSEKIGKKQSDRIALTTEGKVRYPSKVDYTLEDLLSDLLHLAARHLNLNGRLIYYLPVTISEKRDFTEFIPSHPCLRFLSFSEQALTLRNYRLMVAMTKVREPEEGDTVMIPPALTESNFRESYFKEYGEHKQGHQECSENLNKMSL